MNRLWRLYL